MERVAGLRSMSKLLALLLLCPAAIYADARTVRVLFIGNSLTTANNLPGMIADIAKSRGDRMIHDSYTPGGARLFHHASDAEVLRKIGEHAWDFVVLQEQSLFPGFSQKQLPRDVFPYAKRLAEAIRRSRRRTSVVFYMTMARRKGDPANRKVSRDLLTYEGMQKRVNRCYLAMAKQNHALIAPVGEVWKTIRKRRPGLELYSDDTHPNRTGTYLAACVFYATLFRRPSSGSSVARQVDNTIAKSIQADVDRIVLKGRRKWDRRK